jgi:hypothetical protein
MKAKIGPFIVFLSLLLLSCEDSSYREYTGYAPVYMSYDDLRTSFTVSDKVPLKDPGKIYFKDAYIFVVEELEGIHVFDNTDPTAPLKKAFVKLPGVIDISISGNTLYADSFIDLVVLDVQNINNISELARVKSVLPYTVPPVEDAEYPTGQVDEKKGVVVDWELRKIRERVDINYGPYPFFKSQAGIATDAMNYRTLSSGGVSSGGVGIGGSMARFGIKNNILYVVNSNSLKVFDITNKANPVKHSDFYPGSGIETMFLTETNMFLGTTTGMIIYDISDPLVPKSRVFFTHARSCDPVIVDDTLAYITLRTGTQCGGVSNVLTVVNIKKINTPSVVATYPMSNPHGLGKDGDLLFICDGSSGLKIYDAADPKAITSNLIYSYPDIEAFDVIPVGNVLILIGDDGLYQYSYSNVSNISLLSSILADKD